MSKIIKECLTWWHNQTVGTRFFTFLWGRFIAKDDSGNRYYTSRDGKKRWVVYHGLIEPTRVPAPWHAWLHGIVDETPSGSDDGVDSKERRSWRKGRVPNLTGTRFAYHPSGSLHKDTSGKKTKTPSYTAWSPDNLKNKG